MPAYEAYKDSNISWVGEIPVTWDSIKLKHVASIRSGDSISKEEYASSGEYDVIGANGKIGELNKINNHDEVITTGRVGTIGTAHKVNACWITDNALILKMNSMISINYALFVIPCLDFELMTSGTAMPLITATKLGNQSLPYPSLAEQSAIAAYLDRKVSHIDGIIAEARASIEEYKAWKASIIYEAVTKGLDKGVEMKDSGVEWIGEIPVGWQIRKIAWDYTVELGKMLDAKRITGDKLKPYLRNADVQWGRINTEELNEMDFELNEYDRYSIIPGDLMVCEGGEIGRCAIVPKEFPCGIFYQKALHRVRPISGKNGNNRYLFYLFYAMAKFDLFSYDKPEKSTIAHLPGETLVRLRIPSPTLQEQDSIADYLDLKCTAIDALIAEKEVLITDLEAYKKSLIFEVVTGKRKVN